jgi:hypothetical protein
MGCFAGEKSRFARGRRIKSVKIDGGEEFEREKRREEGLCKGKANLCKKSLLLPSPPHIYIHIYAFPFPFPPQWDRGRGRDSESGK